MKKAQAWGFDLIAAVMIFLLAIAVFFSYSVNLPSDNEDKFQALSFEGRLVGDSLLSEGIPPDWDESDVLSIGILSGSEVNESKIKMFYELTKSDYSRAKGLFNVRNDFYVFFDENVSIDGVEIDGVGAKPSGQENLVKLTRIVIYNNKLKNLNIYMWN